MLRILSRNILMAATILFISCGGAEKTEEALIDGDKDVSIADDSKFNAQNVFNTIPERELIMKLIAENKIEYAPQLLNDPQSVNKYVLESVKAVNLGIYGSDLSIASSFDQTQESMIFLKCVNVLAGQLGVNSAFDQHMFERIDANETNKDSVLEIVTNAFRRVDEILKVNNRPATAAVILSGCWIEGLYVSCQIAQKADSESIIKTILSQKESLHNLIVLLESVTLDEHSGYILKDLQSLHETFQVAQTSTKLDKVAIDGITKKITELRNKITTV